MKYLLILFLVLVVVWLWRRERPAKPDASPPARPASKGVTEIVACSVCHVHLPRSEALIGREGGVYCSDAHRREAGG